MPSVSVCPVFDCLVFIMVWILDEASGLINYHLNPDTVVWSLSYCLKSNQHCTNYPDPFSIWMVLPFYKLTLNCPDFDCVWILGVWYTCHNPDLLLRSRSKFSFNLKFKSQIVCLLIFKVNQDSQVDVILLASQGVSFTEVLEGLILRRGVSALHLFVN